MEAAAKISFFLLVIGSCQAGILPILSSNYYPSATTYQPYYYYPQMHNSYSPYYYDYRVYPNMHSYPSMYYPNSYSVYNGFPTHGYYPIPLYDFQINILRVIPDVKKDNPELPKPAAKPEIPTTPPVSTSTPQTMTEVEDEYDEDTIEKLDTKIVTQTSSDEVIANTSEEVESITMETDRIVDRK